MPGYEATQWYGLLAPAGTPPETVARIKNELEMWTKVAKTAGIEPQ